MSSCKKCQPEILRLNDNISNLYNIITRLDNTLAENIRNIQDKFANFEERQSTFKRIFLTQLDDLRKDNVVLRDDFDCFKNINDDQMLKSIETYKSDIVDMKQKLFHIEGKLDDNIDDLSMSKKVQKTKADISMVQPIVEFQMLMDQKLEKTNENIIEIKDIVESQIAGRELDETENNNLNLRIGNLVNVYDTKINDLAIQIEDFIKKSNWSNSGHLIAKNAILEAKIENVNTDLKQLMMWLPTNDSKRGKSLLTDKKKTEMPEQKSFICKYCGKGMHKESGLVKHVETKHQEHYNFLFQSQQLY